MDQKTFTFRSLPQNKDELMRLPESALTEPYQTAALVVCALCRYENSPEDTFAMLDWLKGPENVSPFEKQFLRDRLMGKTYKIRSFFCGSTPENGYQPEQPYTITVSANPYSFTTENWATLYLKSSGADAPRSIKLRKKPSTGQWFLNEIQFLSDIRLPVESDPWA